MTALTGRNGVGKSTLALDFGRTAQTDCRTCTHGGRSGTPRIARTM
ncbi:MAG: hypothetical protein V9G11_07100 [Bifidobacterium adolescentis]